MRIVGVDPGVTGALAVFDRGSLVQVLDMPVNAGRVNGAEIAAWMHDLWGPEAVFLEWTQPMPKNGSIANYSLGLNTGIVVGVVQALGIPLERVRPAEWKLKMGLRGKDKSASRGMATELWPDFADQFRRVKDDGRAEAALIARYGAYRNIHAAVTGEDDDEEDEEGGPVADVSDLRGSRSRHPSTNGRASLGTASGVEP